MAIKGKFDKWNATLTFTSPEVTSGVLTVQIQAATVDTGSGLKNSKLKGADFFDVANNPLITFKSTKLVQTGPNTFEVDGNFTIRGVTRPEKLTLDGVRQGHRLRRDHGDNGLRPQELRHEQRHPVHQDRRPRPGDSRTSSKASKRPASEA